MVAVRCAPARVAPNSINGTMDRSDRLVIRILSSNRPLTRPLPGDITSYGSGETVEFGRIENANAMSIGKRQDTAPNQAARRTAHGLRRKA